MTKKNKGTTRRKWLEMAIKLGVVILLGVVLYNQVFAREDISDIQTAFTAHFRSGNLQWLIFAILLMPVNWAFETLKWRTLVVGFEDLSFFRAYRGILSGITFSLFTPNRIGEYGGRILIVKPENNWKAVIATLVGSFCQMLILLTLGFIGLIFFAQQFLSIDPLVLQGLIFLGFILVSILLFCFYNIDLVVPIVKRLPFIHYLKRFVKHIKILKNYSSRELTIALLYGTLRYFTYSFQYYLILLFFEINVPIGIGFASIATIFLLQTSIPLPPIIGLLTRSQIALYVWGHYTDQQIDILAATFGLFVLNLIVPAILGLFIIVTTNVLQSLGVDGQQKKTADEEE